MDQASRSIQVMYSSDSEEPFLSGDIEVGDYVCCQVLKKEELGPVYVAFYHPITSRQILVPAEGFIDAVRNTANEVRKFRG